jgi:hypothetical protein
MNSKTNFDPELPTKLRRCYRSVRSIGHLMIVVAVSGLLLSVLPAGSRRHRAARVPRNVALIPRPGESLQAKALPEQTRDPFVIMAPAEIDPKMVKLAPAGIDEEMVVNPYSRGGQSPRRQSPPGNRPAPLPGRGPAPGSSLPR